MGFAVPSLVAGATEALVVVPNDVRQP
jgi:hypothetical protein